MAISFDWYENPQQDPIPVYAERGGCNGSAGRTITSYG